MKERLKNSVKWALLSALSGVLAGSAAALFMNLLAFLTAFRIAHPTVIYSLPFFGLLTGFLYSRFGAEIKGGNNLILEEIHNPRKIVPLRMTPLILFTTLLTHLGGGSAGREGTVVQMGASLSDQLSRVFRLSPKDRKILLVAGTGAGFGAALGTPLAGMIFGMEVLYVGQLKIFAWFECFVAAFLATYTTHLLGVKHLAYPFYGDIDFSFTTLGIVGIAGIAFGLSSRIFVGLTHVVETLFGVLFKNPIYRPAAAGVILVVFFCFEGMLRYAGLGLDVIVKSLDQPALTVDPLWKTLATALTVGSGFKGGEFIPLVFIGATLGSLFSLWLPISTQLIARLGFGAVFAGAANTPVACALMIAELFGYKLFPYAIVACYFSYFASGKRGIYKAQKFRGQVS